MTWVGKSVCEYVFDELKKADEDKGGQHLKHDARVHKQQANTMDLEWDLWTPWWISFREF